jgi:pyruvate/2-oxoglutarate dehydrogenase complex dihydrolipoamide dehydrogenase (E3) component
MLLSLALAIVALTSSSFAEERTVGFAVGDAAQMGPPLTPVSNHEGKVVTANLLEGNHRKPNYDGVPSVVFTIPPLARVGLSEEEARAKGLSFRVTCDETPGWFNAAPSPGVVALRLEFSALV